MHQLSLGEYLLYLIFYPLCINFIMSLCLEVTLENKIVLYFLKFSLNFNVNPFVFIRITYIWIHDHLISVLYISPLFHYFTFLNPLHFFSDSIYLLCFSSYCISSIGIFTLKYMLHNFCI